MRYNMLIVEDDEIQRKNLKLMLEEIDEDINVFEAASIHETMNILSKTSIDLFYLDQNLPDGSGIELGRKIREISQYRLTWVVFMATHVQYMLEAFKEVHCYDYIPKPFSKEQIKSITSQLIQGIYVNKGGSTRNDVMGLGFDVNGINLKVNADQIYFIEVNLRTCFVHTKSGVYKVRKTSLKTIKEKLPEDTLLQSHRAFLVNMKYAEKLYHYKDTWALKFKDYDQTALIGRTFKTRIFEYINENTPDIIETLNDN